jgi:hypothetical protein
MSRISDPYWALLLDRTDVCRYLRLSRAQFQALINGGMMPAGRLLAGELLWHRCELEHFAARLFGLEVADQHEQQKASARRALDAFDPLASRRGNPRRGRADVPVLPAQRPKNSATTS